MFLYTYAGFQPKRRKLRKNAVPSKFPWTKEPTQATTARSERMKERVKSCYLEDKNEEACRETDAMETEIVVMDNDIDISANALYRRMLEHVDVKFIPAYNELFRFKYFFYGI